MTAYSQLSDAELVRKVQELMGYKFNAQGKAYTLERDDIATDMKYEYLIDAPDPLTDANVCMALVDEMEEMGYYVSMDGEKTQPHCVDAISDDDTMFSAYNASRARAVCEVYCQVKEGKG